MSGFIPQGGFDANTVEPSQGGQKHPVGLFPASIKNTAIVPAKDEKSGMLRVTFETPVGTIDKNYNLWPNQELNTWQQTKDIAEKQLSALCHATGVFKLNYANQGRELVNSRLGIEVGWQRDQEPGSEKGGPNGGFVEVKKVLDAAGNEPGKAPAPQQQQNNQPQQQPQNNNWGNQQQPQQTQAPMQQQSGGGWGQPQQQPQQNNTSGGNPNPPPWGQR